MGWECSVQLDLFLAEYSRLAKIYLDFKGCFVENESLKDRERTMGIAASLELNGVDQKLINDRVYSKNDKPELSQQEEDTIINSDAFEFYRQMQKQGVQGF